MGLNRTMGAVGQSSVHKASRQCCMLLAHRMNRFQNAWVGCQHDGIWHLTICDVWGRKCDAITKDSAICSVALRRNKSDRKSADLLGIMAFAVRSDKASHFEDVICCDQWRLPYTISNQRCLWDIKPCQAAHSRIRMPLRKQTFAFATHLFVCQIFLLQSALLWNKLCQGQFSRLRNACSDLSPFQM